MTEIIAPSAQIDPEDDDSELPIEIVHECRWFNSADNDDPFRETNFLCYRFDAELEEVVVLVELSDPYSATIMNPRLECGLNAAILRYLRKRFERVIQTTGNGFTTLWDDCP